MESPKTLKSALRAAGSFLEPFLSRAQIEKARTPGLIDQLSQNSSLIEPENLRADSARSQVVRKALALLSDIHNASRSNESRSPSDDIDLLNRQNQRILQGLLDLIFLEGVYPFLSAGVGLPVERKVNSILAVSSIASVASSGDDAGLLQEVLGVLVSVLQSQRSEVQSYLQGRYLIDFIAASAELAFGPRYELSLSREENKTTLACVIDATSLQALFSDLTSLVHPSTPPWLRSYLTGVLSMLPLRPQGVRQVIEFIASTVSSDEPASTASPSQGVPLSLEALTQGARLLASVPSQMTPTLYFDQISSQVLALLDGGAGPDMIKAAGLVIGTILSRRVHGAPGQAGWKVFADPMILTIDPRNTMEAQGGQIIITSAELDIALQRLANLMNSHPNPGLGKRLLGPLMLPLWAIASVSSTQRNHHLNQARSLLEIYLKTSAGTDQLTFLSRNLLFKGRRSKSGACSWEYFPSQTLGVEIRTRVHSELDSNDLIDQLGEADARVGLFVDLLRSGVVDDDGIASCFLQCVKAWLANSRTAEGDQSTGRSAAVGPQGLEPVNVLINIKVIQEMLQHFKEKVVSDQSRMLQLVNEILGDFTRGLDIMDDESVNLKNPTSMNLGHIVSQNARVGHSMSTFPHAVSAEGDGTDIVSVAFSLLSATLSSPGFGGFSEKETALMQSLSSYLKAIANRSELPDSIIQAASNILFLLTLTRSSPDSVSPSTKEDSAILEDRKAYSLALKYLSDPVPPVRAHGLYLLSDLITSTSPTIDVPTIASLLISLSSDLEEYNYLATIATLTVLGTKHPRTVTKLLVDRYVDRDEEMTLDSRLRLGEALLQISWKCGGELASDVADTIAEACIAIAGRRAQKPKAEQQRLKQDLLNTSQRAEAESAWGGNVPNFDDDEDEQEGKISEKQKILQEQIVSGWSANAGSEDLRIRASALSVLGGVIDANISTLHASFVSTAIELSVAALTQETRPQGVTLRRAAVMTILSFLNGLETSASDDRALGFGLGESGLQELRRVMGFVRATDGDGLVREHAASVEEALDAHAKRRLVTGGLADEDLRLPTTLAGLTVDPEVRKEKRPKIEELD
ncbi:MAG: hypothetical protein M1825_000364 [Sarcosagium campestre]|nr:MAG: hypothetical protein M1825_000364 [Sarcosagium campestre]